MIFFLFGKGGDNAVTLIGRAERKAYRAIVPGKTTGKGFLLVNEM
jgi:hypothetical protein